MKITQAELRKKLQDHVSKELSEHTMKAAADAIGRAFMEGFLLGDAEHVAWSSAESMALDDIADTISGVEWDSETCSNVADVIRRTGRKVEEP